MTLLICYVRVGGLYVKVVQKCAKNVAYFAVEYLVILTRSLKYERNLIFSSKKFRYPFVDEKNNLVHTPNVKYKYEADFIY